MRLLFLIFTFLVLSSACGKKDASNSCNANFETSLGCVDLDSPASSNTPLLIDPTSGLPKFAFSFATELELMNYDAEEEKKVRWSAELIKKVVASEEFREAVINHTYNGILGFEDSEQFTNEEIYQIILEGAERLFPIVNNTMDVKLQLYYEETNVIGYTYATSDTIWINRKYFDVYNAAQVSGNLMHEWLHKLGFMHSYEYTETRRYSVPYAVGYLMARLAANYLGT